MLLAIGEGRVVVLLSVSSWNGLTRSTITVMVYRIKIGTISVTYWRIQISASDMGAKCFLRRGKSFTRVMMAWTGLSFSFSFSFMLSLELI